MANKTLLWRALRRDIYERDGGLCQFCGSAIADEEWHIDHVVPKCLGGLTEPENLQLVHGRCNSRKGVRAPVAMGLISVAEAARRLRCSRTQVYNMIHRQARPLPAIRRGSAIFIRAADIG